MFIRLVIKRHHSVVKGFSGFGATTSTLYLGTFLGNPPSYLRFIFWLCFGSVTSSFIAMTVSFIAEVSRWNHAVSRSTCPLSLLLHECHLSSLWTFPFPIDWTIILTSLEKIQVAAMQNMQWLRFYRDWGWRKTFACYWGVLLTSVFFDNLAITCFPFSFICTNTKRWTDFHLAMDQSQAQHI